MTARSLACVAAAMLSGCFSDYQPRTPQERALFQAGTVDMHACVRVGAALRSTCGANTDCRAAVTRDMTYHCYAGAYQGHPKDSICWWKAEDEHRTIESFAASYCEKLDSDVRAACAEEIRAAAALCTTGDPAVTGAGP